MQSIDSWANVEELTRVNSRKRKVLILSLEEFFIARFQIQQDSKKDKVLKTMGQGCISGKCVRTHKWLCQLGFLFYFCEESTQSARFNAEIVKQVTFMEINVYKTKEQLGTVAAAKGAGFIRHAIRKNGHASIIVATGASQFEMLSALIKEEIDWSKVVAFHLDEYIGIPPTHPASFRKYLKERFVDLVPLKEFHYIDGEADSSEEIGRLNALIVQQDIDVAFVGIGENGHLAFNDPPADLVTTVPYLEVKLDHDCRQQQFNEGWFPSVEEVPERAISMSVNHILKSHSIICTVPGERKAEAIKRTLEKGVRPEVPASALRSHNSVYIYLDHYSSSMLPRL
jgi:glucosamine-6-phosphate deaminase